MPREPFVIGICGATGSGKSWFASKLKNALGRDACIFTLDSYYKNVEYINTLEYRHDNPNAINYDKAYNDLSVLLSGNELNMPVYDYGSHKVVSEVIYTLTPVIIVEGLFAFSDERIRSIMNMRIWIEAHKDIRLERRIKRDIEERGDNIEDAMSRYKNDAEPAFEKIIHLGKSFSDFIYQNSVNNGKEPLLVDMISKYVKI